MTATMTAAAARPAADEVTRRFGASAAVADGWLMPNDAFDRWFAGQVERNRFVVRRIPFDGLRGWGFDPATGNLRHVDGRFFTIEGLRVESDRDPNGGWSQPIIHQPEIGILGIVVKEFDGVLHCLLQAKMEPGNVNCVQLSPTVQATRSNYTGAHGGRPVPYLEHFAGPSRGRILVDSLQSEQAAWFLRKRNRNVVVEVTGDVPLLDNFCWLTIGQVHRLLRVDNVVNMDARTVLSCMPLDGPDGPGRGDPDDVWSWLIEEKTRRELVQRVIPLRAVDGWCRSADEIAHRDGRHFRVIAVDVRATNREVGSWTQPLLAPVERGLMALIVRAIDGVPHVLLQVRSDAGVFDVAEFGPTVQCRSGHLTGAAEPPRYLDAVCGAAPHRVRYDVVLSEEGGRFHRAENTYRIVEAGPELDLDVPAGYRWVSLRRAEELLRHGGYLNVEARSLLAALHAIR